MAAVAGPELAGSDAVGPIAVPGGAAHEPALDVDCSQQDVKVDLAKVNSALEGVGGGPDNDAQLAAAAQEALQTGVDSYQQAALDGGQYAGFDQGQLFNPEEDWGEEADPSALTGLYMHHPEDSDRALQHGQLLLVLLRLHYCCVCRSSPSGCCRAGGNVWGISLDSGGACSAPTKRFPASFLVAPAEAPQQLTIADVNAMATQPEGQWKEDEEEQLVQVLTDPAYRGVSGSCRLARLGLSLA
jgi:hypothetical protein